MIEWRGHWRAFDALDREPELLLELARETGPLNPRHVLHGKTCKVIGWLLLPHQYPPSSSRPLFGWKELILFIPLESRYAFVHLTWNEERDPRWPMCKIFESEEELNEFVRKG